MYEYNHVYVNSFAKTTFKMHVYNSGILNYNNSIVTTTNCTSYQEGSENFVRATLTQILYQL